MCRAIRYKIDIPPVSQRPLRPGSEKPTPLPYTIFCHCDDCRRATASLVLSGFFVPKDMVSVSLQSRSSPPPSKVSKALDPVYDDAIRSWVPASEVFAPVAATADSFLALYKSSEMVYRYFCARCGTNVCITRYPMREHWPQMLDVLLGSIDRGDLKNELLVPDKHVFWESGVPWFTKLLDEGSDIPKDSS